MVSDWLSNARSQWRYTGRDRPPFALSPGAGQESVWDYPRPPRAVIDPREVVISLGDHRIARSTRSVRVLETASPPTFYLPPEDIDMTVLRAGSGSSMCEWKGRAQYWTVVVGEQRLERVAWSYPQPFEGYESLRGYLAFYPDRLRCEVDGVRALPQPGHFYAGWVTPEVVGPFKGHPGTDGW